MADVRVVVKAIVDQVMLARIKALQDALRQAAGRFETLGERVWADEARAEADALVRPACPRCGTDCTDGVGARCGDAAVVHLTTTRLNPLCREPDLRARLTSDPRLVTCEACRASPAWEPALARHSSAQTSAPQALASESDTQ